MNVKDRYTFIFLVLFGLKYISYVQGASSLSQSSYTVKGFPASLQCTVTPLSGIIEFQLNSVVKGRCSVPGNQAFCTTSVSQSGDTTYFNISSLSYTEHDGVWTCVNYLGNKDTNLTVYSPFGDTSITSTKTKLLSGESTQLTCRMKCQYPINSGFSSVEIWKNDGKIKSLTSYTATTPSASDGCEAHEQNLDAVFTIFSTDACGNDNLYCKFHHDVLGTNTSNSLSLEFSSCQSTTVLSSTVQSSTTKSPLVCKYCLISDCLLLWQCILVWIAIILAVIILIGCCGFCLWKHRQKSEKDENIDIKIQNLKDKSGNNSPLDVNNGNNDDKSDLKSNDNPGYDHV